jgi:hypothetical protein
MEGDGMTREEHLAWCKERALEYLDRGEVRDGFMSMLSDLRKHIELEGHIGIQLGVGLMLTPGWIENEREVRHWIEGFK